MFYNPVLSRDPVEAFETWFTYQWEGGIVSHEWLERTYDIKPVTMGDTDTFSIRGLRDLHPDPDHEEFMALRELGVGMMTFYKEYAAKNDNFIVVSPEAKFSVPLGFEMIDYREQSPNYGKKIEVHARGMRDAITYSEETGKYAIMDHKTAAKVDEDYFTKLDTDPQCSTYIWASIREAEMHDLPYKEIDSVLYNVLRKTYPKPPTPLKNGTPSVNRTEEGTTAELFEAFVRDGGLVEWFENNDKAQGYYSWLLEMGDANFIQREVTYRNKAMIYNTGQNIKAIAKEMLNPKLAIYPHYSGDFMCTRCAFRAPCIAKEDGSDVDFLIDNGYERNRGR
jgi:hypothetical protein